MYNIDRDHSNKSLKVMTMDTKNLLELFQVDDRSIRVLFLYRQTKNLYNRTKAALGQISTIQVTNSNSKEISVNNVTQTSTKIYPVK